MNGFTLDAQRTKETPNKVVFKEVENDSRGLAVGSVYVSKWMVEQMTHDGPFDKIKVTVEAVR